MRSILSLVAVLTAMGIGGFAFLSAEITIAEPAERSPLRRSLQILKALRRPRGSRRSASSPRWALPKRREFRERLPGWSKKARQRRLPVRIA